MNPFTPNSNSQCVISKTGSKASVMPQTQPGMRDKSCKDTHGKGKRKIIQELFCYLFFIAFCSAYPLVVMRLEGLKGPWRHGRSALTQCGCY